MQWNSQKLYIQLPDNNIQKYCVLVVTDEVFS